MAANNLAELERALVNADAAGDTEAAQVLAGEILKQRGTSAPAAEKPFLTRVNEAISSVMPDSVNKVVDAVAQPASGVLEGAAGMLNLPGSIVRAGGEAAGVSPEYLPMTTGEIEQEGKAAGVTAPDPTSGAGRVARRAGKEVGGAVVAGAPILKAAEMGMTGASVFRPAVEAAKAAPGKFAAAETAAAASAGTGAGIAQEIAPGSTGAEITGLLVGSVAPTALAGSVRRLVRGGEGTRQAMEKTVKEFAEAGVEPTVGMATRRRFNQAVESGLAILPGSSGRMAVYAEKAARKLYDNVDNVTSGIAPIRSTDKAGAAIKEGVEGFVARFKDRWRKIDAPVSKVFQVTDGIRVRNTRAAMVEIMEPGTSSAYPELASFAQRIDQLSRGGAMSYGDLRTLRSSVGNLIPDAWAHKLDKGKLKQLYAAMNEDLRQHLKARAHASVSVAKRESAAKALAALERSDKYYKVAMNRLDERLAPILTSDIPERMFLALERSGHAGRTVINAAKRSIGKENWDVVAGTIFQRMGTAKPGAQDAAGEIFSVETFLTNWNKYARNRGTLEALTSGTSGGAQFAKDMTAVAKVAERFREAGRVFANPSGTARAIANVGLGTSIATAAIGGQVKTAATILTVAASANLSARAFTNPKVVRFLARSTEVPAARMPSLIARLGASMADEPEDVQVEVAAFLDRLSDEFSAEAQRQ